MCHFFSNCQNPQYSHCYAKDKMDKNTTTSSRNGHNPERVPTCMTAAELASYQAQWEQIDSITAQKLREAKGMPPSYQRILGPSLTYVVFQNEKRKSCLRDSAYRDIGMAVLPGVCITWAFLAFCVFIVVITAVLLFIISHRDGHFAFCFSESWPNS